MYLVYLVSQSESATILEKPLARAEAAVITDELIRNVVSSCLADNGDELPDGFGEMSGDDALVYLREDVGYYCSEDTIVFVQEEGNIELMLEKVGDALSRTMQDDSSCYAAAEAWGAVVIEHGLAHFEV